MFSWNRLQRHPWFTLTPPALTGFAFALLLSLCGSPLQAEAPNDTPVSLKAQRYSIDPFRSFMEFSVGFMRIKTAEGTFHDYSGTIMHSQEDLTRSSVSVVIKAESIFTGVKPRDNHLRSSDFFEVDKYPYIVFTSTGMQSSEEGHVLSGRLTMHGATRPVEVFFSQEANDPERLVFRGSARLKRRDFGVIGNFWGNQVLGNEVQIELHIEAVPVEEGSFSPPRFSPRSLSERLAEAALDGNLVTLRNAYRSLKMQSPRDYDFDATGLLELAVTLKRRGELEAAEQVLRFNLEEFPGDLTTRDFLGYIEAIQGHTEAAIQTYRELMRESPYNSGAMEMLRWLDRNRPRQARLP